MPGTLDLVSLGVFLALVVSAAVTDLRSRRIPNAIPLALAILFLATSALQARWPVLGAGLGAGFAGLAVGVLGFRFRVWGGGDAKLTAAVALWTGWAGFPRFIMVMAVAGGVLALIYLARRALARQAAGQDAATLPYGVAIAAGACDWLLSRILFVANV